MPNLVRIAQKGTVYHQHYSAGNFTAPGTASLLTGSYPWTHRAMHYFATIEPKQHQQNLFSLFSEADYHTFAYTHNGLAMELLFSVRDSITKLLHMGELSVFDDRFSDELFRQDYLFAFTKEADLRGFNKMKHSSLFFSFISKMRHYLIKQKMERLYQQQFPLGVIQNFNDQYFILEDAIDWISNQIKKTPQPYMGYFHLWPPHSPYITRKEFVDYFNDGWSPISKPEHILTEGINQNTLNDLRRRYDESLLYVDVELGRLIDNFEEVGLLDNTIVIITSDHGELFERGISRHLTPVLFEPVVHIPLVILKPGQKERIDIHTPTSSIDILATLANEIDQPIPELCEGIELPTSDVGMPNNHRSIYSLEAKLNPKFQPISVGSLMLRKGRYKLLHYFGYEQCDYMYELYDVENDPEELNDLYSQNHPVAKELKFELQSKLNEVNSPEFWREGIVNKKPSGKQ